MSSKRITVPADQIKRRCICRQCGRDVYDPEPVRDSRKKDKPARREDEAHRDHVYPHPDTWEP